jgi:polysaccharide deacetylase family protein (PEP-CTERM system associated)
MKFKHIMTFDIEEWYCASLIRDQIHGCKEAVSTVEENTLEILRLLHKHNSFATFFVLGSVARKCPSLVEEIERNGHEIGLHSNSHNLIYNMSQDEFIRDLEEGLNSLNRLVKRGINGYRAPSWSVSKSKTEWFWDILYKYGFKYSSSVFPFGTFLYGNSKASIKKNRIYCGNGYIWEIPPSVIEIMKIRAPFSGGFYFRFLPAILIDYGIKLYHQITREPAVLYLHPYEIDSSTPRVKLSPKDYFIQYYNLNKTKKKLDAILNKYDFVSINQFYDF